MKIIASWSGILAAWVLPILLNMNAVGLVTVETMMMFRSAPPLSPNPLLCSSDFCCFLC